MASRTKYIRDTMEILIRDHENSRSAFDSVYSAYPFATDLEVTGMAPAKNRGAVITVSFTRRVRLSKAERLQA